MKSKKNHILLDDEAMGICDIDANTQPTYGTLAVNIKPQRKESVDGTSHADITKSMDKCLAIVVQSESIYTSPFEVSKDNKIPIIDPQNSRQHILTE